MGDFRTTPTPLTPQDAEHLRMLSIAHFIVAGLTVLFACFPVIHLVVGIGLLTANGEKGAPPAAVGILFIAIAVVFILAGWSLAACIAYAGKNLAERRRHTFCLVVAGVVAAACVPLGTVLGVLTIIVLLRPTVKAAFGVAPASPVS